MDLRKMFGTNKRAETEGRKLFLSADKKTWLLIARKTNTNYRTYLQKLLQENQLALQGGGPEAEALATSLFKEAASKHLLIGWSPAGIDLDDATNIPYSHEASAKLLEMDDLYKKVDEFADSMANYREAEVAKEEGN